MERYLTLWVKSSLQPADTQERCVGVFGSRGTEHHQLEANSLAKNNVSVPGRELTVDSGYSDGLSVVYRGEVLASRSVMMGDSNGVNGDLNANLRCQSTGDPQLDKAVHQWLTWDQVSLSMSVKQRAGEP